MTLQIILKLLKYIEFLTILIILMIVKVIKSLIKPKNISEYKVLKDYCHFSNNLYNYSLYVANQHFKETGKYVGRFKLEKSVKENENYKMLPAQHCQQLIKLIDQNFRSFMSLLKKKNNGSYKGEVKPPRFKKKGAMYSLFLTYQSSRIKDGFLYIPMSREYKKKSGIGELKIKFCLKENQTDYKTVSIKPMNNGQYFKLYVVYKEEEQLTKENKNYETLKTENKLSIDFGINNLMSCYSNVTRPFIVNGKPIKSFNCYYNKHKSKKKSELKTKNNKNWSNSLQRLEIRRENVIDDYFHQTTSQIVKVIKENKIGQVIIGYNKDWKTGINIGSVNNQKFYCIPFYKLKEMLKYKLHDIGVDLTINEESYTSKCSFLDKEKIQKQDSYMGRRIKRGLFKTLNGILINSDVNGAANIMRKVVGDVVYDDQPISGAVLNPVKLKNFHKQIC